MVEMQWTPWAICEKQVLNSVKLNRVRQQFFQEANYFVDEDFDIELSVLEMGRSDHFERAVFNH